MPNPSLSTCRSWLFVPGHDPARLVQALAYGAEAIVVDLEEFTPAPHRGAACADFLAFASDCRRLGRLPAARINRLADGGHGELAELMPAIPAAIFLPRVESAQDVTALDLALHVEEARCGVEPGATALIPTLETRLGIERAHEILAASPRLSAALIGTGDLAGDLGLSASATDDERVAALAPWRVRFLAACRDTGCLAIDGPWPQATSFAADQDWSMAQGYRARCVVDPGQVPLLHRMLGDANPATPGAASHKTNNDHREP